MGRRRAAIPFAGRNNCSINTAAIKANYGLTTALFSLTSRTSIFAPRLNCDTTSRSFRCASSSLSVSHVGSGCWRSL